MENPHNLPAPTDPIDKIHDFVRDMAYGAALQMWNGADVNNPQLRQLIQDKWGGSYPNFQLLHSFGYLQPNPLGSNNYSLTLKAFQLLEKPSKLPSVFIAYGKQESSALGLAVEYRLSSLGVSVFIDRSIPDGAAWDEHLKQTPRNSEYVVCLLAPSTLQRSSYIREEIELAHDTERRVIPILHSNFDPKQHFHYLPESLKAFILSRQYIEVKGESAAEYHSAVERLINALGIPLRQTIGA